MSVSRNRIDVTQELFGLPCACGSLRRLTRVVTRLYDDALRSSGVEVMQFGILAALDRLSEATQSQLSRGFALDSTTLTRTLALLQRRGWIDSRPGTDRRQRIFTLTREGRARLNKARPLWRAAQAELESVLGKDTVASLTQVSNEKVAELQAWRLKVS